MSLELFDQVDAIHTQRLTDDATENEGHDKDNQHLDVSSVPLKGGHRLRAAFSDEETFWLEIIFSDGRKPVKVWRRNRMTPAQVDTLTQVVQDNAVATSRR